MGRCQHLSDAKAHCKFNKKWNGIWVSKQTQQPIISLKNYCKNVIFSSSHSFFGKMHSESLSPTMRIAQERAVTLACSLCYAWASQIRGSEKSQLVCCPGHTHSKGKSWRPRFSDVRTSTLLPPNHSAGHLFNIFNKCLSNLLGHTQEARRPIWTTGKFSPPNPEAPSSLWSRKPSHSYVERPTDSAAG